MNKRKLLLIANLFYSIMLASSYYLGNMWAVLTVLTISIVSILYINENKKITDLLHSSKWF
jgi:hypothetical protein